MQEFRKQSTGTTISVFSSLLPSQPYKATNISPRYRKRPRLPEQGLASSSQHKRPSSLIDIPRHQSPNTRTRTTRLALCSSPHGTFWQSGPAEIQTQQRALSLDRVSLHR